MVDWVEAAAADWEEVGKVVDWEEVTAGAAEVTADWAVVTATADWEEVGKVVDWEEVMAGAAEVTAALQRPTSPVFASRL